jgi:LacI family transcriptional regulator
VKKLIDHVTIKDIAQKANTSIGTVDRVIYNRPGVSEKTRLRVFKILKENNYRPNFIVRNLIGKKKIKIAVLIPSSKLSFWKLHHEGIDKAAKELRIFNVKVDTYTFDFNSKEDYIESLKKIKDKKYDALLTVPVYCQEVFSFLRLTGIESIFFDTNVERTEELNTHYIGENAYQTGMVAGKLLSPGIKSGDAFLIISVERFSPHLQWKEIGIKDFFFRKFSTSNIEKIEFIKMELTELSDKIIEEKIVSMFRENPNISRVFINSCRATSLCAPYLEKEKLSRENLLIAGYDLTEENIAYLENGTIDYLINKHPREQCYKGLKMLYDNLVLKTPIPPQTYMPIDIVIKENIDYNKMLQPSS